MELLLLICARGNPHGQQLALEEHGDDKRGEDGATRETTKVSVFGQPESEGRVGAEDSGHDCGEGGTGVRDSIFCCVPSIWRDPSPLQRVGREDAGWRMRDSQAWAGADEGKELVEGRV